MLTNYSYLLIFALLFGCSTGMPEAAKNGNISRVREALSQGISPNSVDAKGYSALFWAAYEGHLEIVDLLIEANAQVSFAGNSDGAPLHAAALNCFPSVIEVLVKNDAQINMLNGARLTPLWLASRYGNIRCVKTLLVLGASVDTQGENSSPLNVAAFFGHLDIVVQLLSSGADTNSLDQHGLTPLHRAIAANRPDIVEVLLEHGADLSAKDKDGRDLLAYSRLHKALNSESVLLEHLQKLDQPD